MPYFGPLPDTLLVGGTDLQSLTGIIVTNLDGLMAPGDRRGENVVVPGRRGAIGVPKVYDAYEFSVGIAVEGTTRADMLTNLSALSTAIAGTSGLMTLTRRLATSGGYVEHTAAGEFNNGLQITLLNVWTGMTELSFTNLDGGWYSAAAPTVLIVP